MFPITTPLAGQFIFRWDNHTLQACPPTLSGRAGPRLNEAPAGYNSNTFLFYSFFKYLLLKT